MEFIDKIIRKCIKPDLEDLNHKIKTLTNTTKPEVLFKSARKALGCIFIDDKRFDAEIRTINSMRSDTNIKILRLEQELESMRKSLGINLSEVVQNRLDNFDARLQIIEKWNQDNEDNIALLFKLLDQVKK